MSNLQIKHIGEMALKFQGLSLRNVASTQVKKTCLGTGEMAHQLRICAALPEEVPSTQVSSQPLVTQLWESYALLASSHICTHRRTLPHTRNWFCCCCCFILKKPVIADTSAIPSVHHCLLPLVESFT